MVVSISFCLQVKSSLHTEYRPNIPWLNCRHMSCERFNFFLTRVMEMHNRKKYRDLLQAKAKAEAVKHKAGAKCTPKSNTEANAK